MKVQELPTTPVTKSLDSYERSDLGNADYFVDREGHSLRWDTARNEWLMWEGHRWQRDRTLRAEGLAQQVARARTRDAIAIPPGKGGQDDPRTRAIRWALFSESDARIRAMLEQAKARLAVNTSAGWDENPWLLGVPNGVVDLRTGELRDGRRSDQITKQARAQFCPSAQATRWSSFMEEIFPGDESLAGFVRRALGYSLSGSVSEHCWFGCYGSGSNGKSTMLNTVAEVLGDYAYVAGFALVERGRGESRRDFDMVNLQGARFVLASETRDGSTWDEERLKRFTGGDVLHAEVKFGSEFNFVPAFKLWFGFNHRPKSRDNSAGFWRRARLIPFEAHFNGAARQVDRHLADKLLAEREGILRWLVTACVDWQRDGLKPPLSVSDATDAYRREEDPLAGFVARHIRKAIGERFKLSEAYVLYKQFCRDSDITELGRTKFGALLDGHARRYNRDGSIWYRDAKLTYVCVCMQKPCRCLTP